MEAITRPAPPDQARLFECDPVPPRDPVAGRELLLDHDLVPGVGFHPAVARWFRRRFPGGPTPPQVEGWPAIAARRHTLIAAPTGSGKTLAGFGMAINRLYLAAARNEATAGTRVVYVSPLKALAVDVAENLERPLAEIAAEAEALGLAVPPLTVGVRTGDTPPGERQAMIRRPPTFMVTTPESLYLLVTAARSRSNLETVDTVIVDEIHALARDKRGSHLAVTLERLAHVAAAPVARVGLSATQRPISTIARLLVGTRATADGEPDCVVVDTGHQRALDLAVELPDAELEAVVSHAQMDQVLDRVAALVGGHHTTLVFVNTRRLAERLAHQLGERLGPEAVAAHHGSLSKDRRRRVERRLRAGELRALVATASLELGIDVGPVELVCQIGSPRSIATFLQRVGRSNHTRHGTPRGRLFPLTRDELVECTALLRAVRAGRLDRVEPPVAPLDILAQQIVAEAGAAEWTVDGLYRLVTRAWPYAGLERAAFDQVVELVADGIVTGRGRRAAWVHHDGINGELRGRRGARYVALTSGGAIPEIYDMRVIAEPEETFIGTVTEDWAIESSAGDIFLLGTHSWRIRQVAGGEVRVIDAGGAAPTVPFWTGEAPARTVELSEEVSRLRADVDGYLVADDPAGAVRLLTESAGIPTGAAALIVSYLAAAKLTLGVMPTGTDLVIERFFDDADGMQLVIHSPLGGRINRAMGYALRKRFCVGFNFELQAAASDDAVVISLGPHHSFPLHDVPRFLRSGTIRHTLTQAVLDQPAFQSRWRWNLNRSLVVLRMRNGKRNPPPIQRMESDDLLAAVFPDAAACQENVTGPITVPDHVLVTQTIHDTLTEGLDVDGLIALWEQVEAGAVRFHTVDSTEPSLLAHEILTARPYAFLDDGEAGERRTLAVPLRRGVPVDPAGRGLLDPGAVAEVAAELAPAPVTTDELHDLLRDTVVLAPHEPWRALYDELTARGRATTVDLNGPRWVATERAADVGRLAPGAAVPADGATPERVAADAIRGHLELWSPMTAAELVERTGFTPTLVEVGLATLETEGSVIQGRFRSPPPGPPGNRSVEWAARRVLARMHRRSRASRRSRVEPATPEAFVRFLARWQHVAPGTQLAGPGGVGTVIDQLQGWEAAVAAWEPDLLAARIDHYQPAWVDRLCHAGELQWLRLSLPGADPDGAERRTGQPSKATPVSLVHRQHLAWLLDAARGGAEPPVPDRGVLAEIVEALGRHGARFATDLAADTGRLVTDIERGLWDGVARGLITADGFAAVRGLVDGERGRSRHRPGPPGRPRLSRLRGGASRPLRAAGRWSLVADGLVPADGLLSADAAAEAHDDLIEAVVDQLLTRWGVLFYDLVRMERIAVPWRDLQWALRRLEDRGLVRGGRFVKGFSGEQFALPDAADQLGRLRRSAPAPVAITVSGADPLNLTGVILPGPRVPARRTERVELIV
ncbi:MAG: DEAD/DEAH box helicase [Acidimicrobiales bacterium]